MFGCSDGSGKFNRREVRKPGACRPHDVSGPVSQRQRPRNVSSSCPCFAPESLDATPNGGEKSACPASSGVIVTHPGMAGVAVGKGLVTAIIGQSGDLAHGIVDLATSNVTGWYGLKTDWAISPRYSGWVIVRGEQLNGKGPVAALADATFGAIVIPPGPTANTFAGWREQPSGTYVKGPGCYGFQVDGSSFSEHIVVEAVLSPGA